MSSTEKKYRCPILQEMGAYDGDYPNGEYDPRHYETMDKMVEHLKSQEKFSWTDEQISKWQVTATPIN